MREMRKKTSLETDLGSFLWSASGGWWGRSFRIRVGIEQNPPGLQNLIPTSRCDDERL